MLSEHCVCVCVCARACMSVSVKMSSNCEPQQNQGQTHKHTVLSHSLFFLTTLDQSEKQYKIDTEGVWCCPFASIIVLAHQANKACICIIMLLLDEHTQLHLTKWNGPLVL
jgi:hypothetical protein